MKPDLLTLDDYFAALRPWKDEASKRAWQMKQLGIIWHGFCIDPTCPKNAFEGKGTIRVRLPKDFHV